MIRGPKYKIARRLGPAIFEKTQTQKFALRSQSKGDKKRGRGGPKSDFGIQMLEKQKARFTYGVPERQFVNYVKASVAKKGVNSVELLYQKLESRLDNVVYRLGLASTRAAGRQMVSHGHILVNGRRVTIPSFQVSLNDEIKIREGSKKSALFQNLDERLKERQSPSWIAFDMEKKEAKVQGAPKAVATEVAFDLGSVIEFYSR
jgi:small subunit ribosomal protein S4